MHYQLKTAISIMFEYCHFDPPRLEASLNFLHCSLKCYVFAQTKKKITKYSLYLSDAQRCVDILKLKNNRTQKYCQFCTNHNKLVATLELPSHYTTRLNETDWAGHNKTYNCEAIWLKKTNTSKLVCEEEHKYYVPQSTKVFVMHKMDTDDENLRLKNVWTFD